MKKSKHYRVIQTVELQVWDGKEQAFKTVVEKASFFKEDDKQLFIGQSAKKCTLYAKTNKGLVAGPSMFTRAEYLGGAFIYSKGRQWFLQFLNSEDCAALGRDATYQCIGGLYVIEAYSVKRRDSIVFLYSPQTQELSMWYDTYYQTDASAKFGVILRQGNDYIHISVTQKKKLLGRYDKAAITSGGVVMPVLLSFLTSRMTAEDGKASDIAICQCIRFRIVLSVKVLISIIPVLQPSLTDLLISSNKQPFKNGWLPAD